MPAFGPYPGLVDRVYDGDTVYCRLDLGFDLTVYARCRLDGINAPELSTPEGKNAHQFLAALVPAGSPVSVTSYGWDKYGGRIDAAVRFNGEDLSSAMVTAGYAKNWTGKGPKP